MNKKLMCCVSMALGIGISASAHAQASMDALCAPRPNAIPCVRDATGKIVGIPTGLYTSRQIKGNWYAIFTTALEVPIQGTYYYAGPNCTGQVYVITKANMPPLAFYDGEEIFSNTDNTDDGFDWQSYSFPMKVKFGGTCHSYGPNCLAQGEPCHASSGGPVSKIETVHFTSPLKMQ